MSDITDKIKVSEHTENIEKQGETAPVYSLVDVKEYTDTDEAHTNKSDILVKDSGIYRVIYKTDKEGNITTRETKLSDPITIVGAGFLGGEDDPDEAYYIVFEYQSEATKETKMTAMPYADIGETAGWKYLKSRGLFITSNRFNRERLTDYLQEQAKKGLNYRFTKKTGWYGNSYILPSGEAINPAGETAENTIFIGDKSQAFCYQSKGTLEEWQDNIAKYAEGNSRFCLALGTAFAAPLLRLLGLNGGGFHIYSDSTDGKTTISKAAQSVWAHEEAFISWNATAYALTNAALARNDGFMLLDEIGEAKNAKDIKNAAYSLANGKGRLQGKDSGGNRKQATFKSMFFSTGEQSLLGYMKAKQEAWHAGQNVRLPSLTASTQHGVFENLHGFKNGRALAKQLERYKKYYGTAGREFVQMLADNRDCIADQVSELMENFIDDLPEELENQILRIADRFAVTAAALELATPITGLPKDEGFRMIRKCFDDWLAENGNVNYEEQKILEQYESFLQMYGDSMRFSDWNAEHTNTNHAGYKRQEGNVMEYWIIPTIFEKEIACTFSKNKTLKVLLKHEILIKPKGDGYQQQKKGGGRYYVTGRRIELN